MGVPWQGNRAVPQTENLIIFTPCFLKTKHRLLMWNTLSHRCPESPVQPGIGSVCVTFWGRGSLWGWAHGELIAPGSNSILTPRKLCKVLGGDNPQAFYFEFTRGRAGHCCALPGIQGQEILLLLHFAALPEKIHSELRAANSASQGFWSLCPSPLRQSQFSH